MSGSEYGVHNRGVRSASLTGTSSLSELQDLDPCYLVTDIDKKVKGVIAVKNHDVIGITVEFSGVGGKLYWSKPMVSLYSLVKVANNPLDLHFIWNEGSGSSRTDHTFRFITTESKLEILFLMTTLNKATRILDDSVSWSDDGTIQVYKVQHITKAKKSQKYIELDLSAGTIIRRGTKGVRDETEINDDLVLRLSGNCGVTYSSAGKTPCALVFPSCEHVFDFVSNVVKVREKLPLYDSHFDMDTFTEVARLAKYLRHDLVARNEDEYNDSNRLIHAIQDVLPAANLDPKFLANPALALNGLFQYGLVKKRQSESGVYFAQNGCGSAVRVRAVTWNVGETTAPSLEEMNLVLGKEGRHGEHDIYAIGLQECLGNDLESYILAIEDCLDSVRKHHADSRKRHTMRSSSQFSAAAGSMPDSPFTTISVQSMWKIHIILVIRTSLVPRVTHLSHASQATGTMGVAGNKGGLGIYLKLFGATSFSFVTAHLAARHSRNKRRARDFRSIVAGLSSKLSHCGNDLLHSCDHSFWFGDLNYRVDYGNHGTREEFNKVVSMSLEGQVENFADFMKHDQLFAEVAASRVFVNFTEGKVSFPPTYRYERGHVQKYSNKRDQNPSYCDRILWHSAFPNDIELLDYNCCMPIKQSDHKPVYASFSVTTRLPYLTPTRFGNICASVGKQVKLVVCDLSFVSRIEEFDAEDGAAESVVDGHVSDGRVSDDGYSSDETDSLQSVPSGTDKPVKPRKYGKSETTNPNSKNFVNTLRKMNHRKSVFNVDRTKTMKVGWLSKKRQGIGFFKRGVWQKRWMELTANYLIYRKNPEPRSPIMASIDLRNLTGCQLSEGSTLYLYCSAFVNGNYPLKAGSREEAEDWAHAIKERFAHFNMQDGDDYLDEDGDGIGAMLNLPSDMSRRRPTNAISVSSSSDVGEIIDSGDFDIISNGRLSIEFISDCLVPGQKTTNVIPEERYGLGSHGTLPLSATKRYIDGFNVRIVEMEQKQERHKVFMSYTLESTNSEYHRPISVTRSFEEFKEIFNMIIRKIPSIERNLAGVTTLFTQKKKSGIKFDYREERATLQKFVQAVASYENVWSLPEFLQFLDDYADFETEKVWTWAGSKPLAVALHDSDWIKMQKVTFRLADASASRLVGGSSTLMGSLVLDNLNRDGAFSIPVSRHNKPHGTLKGRIALSGFDLDMQCSKYMVEGSHYDKERLADAVDICLNELTTEVGIAIDETKLMALQEKKSFTNYIVSVSFRGKAWTIESRFSGFYDLYVYVLESLPHLKRLIPKVPEKKMFNSLSQNIVRDRQEKLNVFVRVLVATEDVWSLDRFVHFIDNSTCDLLKTVQTLRILRTSAWMKRFPGSLSAFAEKAENVKQGNGRLAEELADAPKESDSAVPASDEGGAYEEDAPLASAAKRESSKSPLPAQNFNPVVSSPESEKDVQEKSISEIRAMWYEKDAQATRNSMKESGPGLYRESDREDAKHSLEEIIKDRVAHYDEEESSKPTQSVVPSEMPQTWDTPKPAVDQISRSSRNQDTALAYETKTANKVANVVKINFGSFKNAARLIQSPSKKETFVLSTNPVTGEVKVTTVKHGTKPLPLGHVTIPVPSPSINFKKSTRRGSIIKSRGDYISFNGAYDTTTKRPIHQSSASRLGRRRSVKIVW